MKTIDYIISRTTFIVLALSMLTLFNCSKDDDENEGPQEDTIINFRLDLIKITGIETQGDGNDALEVYGDITARLNFNGAFTEDIIWSKEQENYVSIEVGDFPIMSSTTYEVLESQLPNMALEVNANLIEHDFNVSNEDDPLGDETLTTLLSGISSTITYDILLDETNEQEVQVTYSITKL